MPSSFYRPSFPECDWLRPSLCHLGLGTITVHWPMAMASCPRSPANPNPPRDVSLPSFKVEPLMLYPEPVSAEVLPFISLDSVLALLPYQLPTAATESPWPPFWPFRASGYKHRGLLPDHLAVWKGARFCIRSEGGPLIRWRF
ncbi:hypothetical protein HGRIS_008400 [Hohenbuehelia grisea]|uniref:Uncharacterized protein n=1 Tax=Hohenbuehelia grisea TaxID=104357 RepID=A0ABR3J877_9AGAR